MSEETSEENGEQQQESQEEKGGTPAIEWAVAALGGLVVLWAFGTLVYESVTDPGLPPDFHVSFEHGPDRSIGHGIEVILENNSRAAAANVGVLGVLSEGGRVVEERRVTLSEAPGRSAVRCTLMFKADPRAHELELRVEGHTQP